MTHISCIQHPESSRYIQPHDWHIAFCQSNHCAALLLAFFIAWHDWKLKHDKYYRSANDIAEMHGDGRPHSESAYLFFTVEELIEGILGFYGKKAVNEALELLRSIGVISINQNPNPRYHFDKTKYFILFPNVCRKWIAKNYPPKTKQKKKTSQPIDSKEGAKMPDREDEKALPSRQNGRPSSESSRAITNTTNNTTNKNQSINTRDDFFENPKNQIQAMHERREVTQTIVDALIEKGMPENKFYPDILDVLDELHLAGATVELFLQGFDMAARVTQAKGFGMNYLIKVVIDLLAKSKTTSCKQGLKVKAPPVPSLRQDGTIYENDFSNAESWAGDLL